MCAEVPNRTYYRVVYLLHCPLTEFKHQLHGVIDRTRVKSMLMVYFWGSCFSRSRSDISTERPKFGTTPKRGLWPDKIGICCKYQQNQEVLRITHKGDGGFPRLDKNFGGRIFFSSDFNFELYFTFNLVLLGSDCDQKDRKPIFQNNIHIQAMKTSKIWLYLDFWACTMDFLFWGASLLTSAVQISFEFPCSLPPPVYMPPHCQASQAASHYHSEP